MSNFYHTGFVFSKMKLVMLAEFGKKYGEKIWNHVSSKATSSFGSLEYVKIKTKFVKTERVHFT